MTYKKTALTIGTFDGVHLGHATIISRLKEFSQIYGLISKIIFFSIPPKLYISGKFSGNLITLPEERKSIFSSMGIDEVLEINFDEKFQNTEANAFFEKNIIEKHRAGALIVGKDFAMGKGRKGDVHFLKDKCLKHSINFDKVDPLRFENQRISSTLIRDFIKKGDMEKANYCMGRPYCITGRVIKGAGLGRKLGFPTANLEVDSRKILPEGIFAVKILCRGNIFSAVSSIGIRPTFKTLDMRLLAEVHILDFSEDIYGEEVKVFFYKKLRPEMKFSGTEALCAQINKDINHARKALSSISRI